MSLPTAPVTTALAQAGSIAPLDMAIMAVNSNPYFIGTMMLMLNFGGRFLALEMSKGQEQFFQSPWVRRCLIFTIIFVGTRNIMVAFWMSLFIILCVGYLFNENSSLCLFHLGQPGSSCATSPGLIQTAPNTLTQEESEILKRLQDKYQKSMPLKENEKEKEKEKETSSSDIYWQNMTYLNKEGFNNPRF